MCGLRSPPRPNRRPTSAHHGEWAAGHKRRPPLRVTPGMGDARREAVRRNEMPPSRRPHHDVRRPATKTTVSIDRIPATAASLPHTIRAADVAPRPRRRCRPLPHVGRSGRHGRAPHPVQPRDRQHRPTGPPRRLRRLTRGRQHLRRAPRPARAASSSRPSANRDRSPPPSRRERSSSTGGTATATAARTGCACRRSPPGSPLAPNPLAIAVGNAVR